MARVSVKLPLGLVGAAGPRELECHGDTIGDALRCCVTTAPQLRSRVLRDDGGVWVGIFINGRDMRERKGLDTRLADGDVITLVPPIAGG